MAGFRDDDATRERRDFWRDAGSRVESVVGSPDAEVIVTMSSLRWTSGALSRSRRDGVGPRRTRERT